MDDNLKDFKICPFCKKTISADAEQCPYCLHILVEKLANRTEIQTSNSTNIDKSNYERKAEPVKVHYYTDHETLHWFRNKRFLIIAGLIVVMIIWFISSNRSPDTTTYISLPNGTTFYSDNRYLSGEGELDIDNGINYDAAVKLINLNTNKLVDSFYIQANSKYKIYNIIDGNYKLLFMHGKNWDSAKSTFLVDRSYYQFDDPLHFETIPMRGKIQTTIFQVTLYPVPEGKARTSSISQSEFDKY